MVDVIGECKVLERARLTPEGLAGTTRLTWVEQPAYGVHRRHVDAKRAWVLAHDPDIAADASDDFIRRHFDAQRRNLGLARVLTRPVQAAPAPAVPPPAALPAPSGPPVPWRPPQQLRLF